MGFWSAPKCVKGTPVGEAEEWRASPANELELESAMKRSRQYVADRKRLNDEFDDAMTDIFVDTVVRYAQAHIRCQKVCTHTGHISFGVTACKAVMTCERLKTPVIQRIEQLLGMRVDVAPTYVGALSFHFTLKL